MYLFIFYFFTKQLSLFNSESVGHVIFRLTRIVTLSYLNAIATQMLIVLLFVLKTNVVLKLQ